MNATTMIEAPAPLRRSLEQRDEALKKANRIRSKRAQLKRDLKSGAAGIVATVIDPPRWADTMKVEDALLALPKYGEVKVDRMLKRQRISPSKTLSGLSQRQRRGLVEELLS